MTAPIPIPIPLPGVGVVQSSASQLAALASGPVLMVTVLGLLAPVMAAVLVLTWHGLRGTNPGPAARQLLALVELVLVRRRR